MKTLEVIELVEEFVLTHVEGARDVYDYKEEEYNELKKEISDILDEHCISCRFYERVKVDNETAEYCKKTGFLLLDAKNSSCDNYEKIQD